MLVLLTNDDGIGARGLHALRRALGEIEGVEVRVIAPHTNRSGTARSITTRSPIWVEEVEFDDGTIGFATEGTPVDCVRFADLGLLGERPDLIVSGINHGSNLGDDVTYSGTVAAAFEGIVLGLPAIAVSQQAGVGGMGYAGPRVRLHLLGGDRPRAGPPADRASRCPPSTLLNVNCPAGEPAGIELARLGKRLYDDELKLVEEDDSGRRRYQIYGFEPSFEDEPGTDLAAVARGRVAITPIHFDLTDHGELERLAAWDLDELGGGRPAWRHADERSRAGARRGAARGRSPSTITATTSSTTRRSATTSTTRCCDELRALEEADPRAAHPGLADPAGRRAHRRSTSSTRSATSSRCSRSATRAARTSSAPGSSACTTGSSASTSSPASCASSPSRRSTGSRSRCSTRTASSSAARPAATA